MINNENGEIIETPEVPNIPDVPEIPEQPTEPESPKEPEEIVTDWIYPTIPDFYNRVRMALNVGSSISDTIINYFENAPMAEMKIKKRVPQWQELDTTKRLLFETCIIYMTCYVLCPLASRRQIAKQKDVSLEIDFVTSTNEKPCARFLDLIDDLIAQINDEEKLPFFLGFEVTKSAPEFCCERNWPHILCHHGKENIPLGSEK